MNFIHDFAMKHLQPCGKPKKTTVTGHATGIGAVPCLLS
jgi:hypothetical protein